MPIVDRWEGKYGQGSHSINNWHLELAQDVLNDYLQARDCEFEAQIGTIDAEGETGVELALAPSKPRVIVWVHSDNASAATRHVATNHFSALRNKNGPLPAPTPYAAQPAKEETLESAGSNESNEGGQSNGAWCAAGQNQTAGDWCGSGAVNTTELSGVAW